MQIGLADDQANASRAAKRTEGPGWLHANFWLLYLLLGLVATGVCFLLSGMAQDTIYLLIGVSAAVAIVAGAYPRRPEPALPWYLVASGLALHMIADAVFHIVYHDIPKAPIPFPSAADAIHLAAYLAVAVGLALLVRHPPGHDHGSLIDAAMVAAGLGLLAWEFLLEPFAEAESASWPPAVTANAYTLASLLWVALVARLLFVSARRPAAFYLLLLAVFFHPISDAVYGVLSLQGAYEYGSPVEAGWLLSYVLFGAAALHPSMREVPEMTSGNRVTVSRLRLGLLALAALAAPTVRAIDVVKGDDFDVVVLAGTFIFVGLVFLRLVGMIRAHESAEEALRHAHGDLEARIQERTAELARTNATLKDEAAERTRAHDLLAESERRFSNLLSNAPAYFYRCRNEPGWPNEFVSNYAHELTGYGSDELTDGTIMFADLILEGDRSRVWEETQAALSLGQRFELHYAIRRKDGAVRHVEERGQGVYAEDGGVEAIEGVIYDLSERVQAEGRIREAESRYRVLVEEVPAITYVHVQEPSGPSATIYVSPQMETVLGYTQEEYTGEPEFWKSILHPEDRDRVLAEDERTGETGEPFNTEFRLIAKDGRSVWLRESGTLSRSEDGKQYWHGIMFDITELKHTENELRGAEERYRSLVEQIPAVVYMDDVNEGNPAIYRSPYVEEMLGYSPEEFVDDPNFWQNILHPEDRNRVLAENERTNESGKPFRIEYRMISRDGKVVWVRDEAVLIRDEEGRRRYWQGIFLDVTERKQAETALRVAEERYRTLVERVPAAIYILDSEPDGASSYAVRYMSPQVWAILGYDPQRFVEAPEFWDDLIHPEDLDAVLAEDSRTDETGEPFSMEYRMMASSGDYRWVSEEAVLIRDEGGRPLYWQGFLSDVTERRLVEEEVRAARDVAEAASRAKSDFLANMSHEIRTPMNGVIGVTELLLDTDLTEEQRDYAETVRSSGEGLLVVINDILDFSKIEAGKVDIENIDFDLRAVTEDTARAFAQPAFDKGLNLVNLTRPEIPATLTGDPFRLRQILSNLLGNAVKFTERGEVALRAMLSEERGEDVVVRFEIEDTGVGMTEDQRRLIFDSFTQADTSTTRRFGGTGLGLAISRRLVELMGGEIGVESQPGNGSTFWFTVGLKCHHMDAAGQPASHARLRDMRVFIVADSVASGAALREQVSSWGVQTSEVHGSAQALEALRSDAENGEFYDLAILDIEGPQADGPGLVEQIEGEPLLSSTRLIVLVPMGQRGDRQSIPGTSITVCLTKPVRHSELYDCLVTAGDSLAGEASAGDAQAASGPVVGTRPKRFGPERGSPQAVDRPRILLAEDNPVNQKVATKILEKLGYRVDVVASGSEAVEALSHVPYEVVLMDVQMPGMDGYEATREVRHREASTDHHTPIIALTANVMEGHREAALDAGMDDYLSKPVRPDEVETTLRRWIPPAGQPENRPLYANSPETGRPESYETLDPATLEDLRELGGEEMLADLAEVFLREASCYLTQIREASETGEAPVVGRNAHALKGSAANMGAIEVAATCERLENAGFSGNLGDVGDLLGILEIQLALTRTALGAVIGVDR